MGNIRPFKFWVQNVLPQVYDDSLSYYELLNKVVAYLNNTTREVNRISKYLEDFLSNLNITEEIERKLDEMALDGTLAEILANWDGVTQFIENEDIRADYKRNVVDSVVSYLSELSYNRSLVGVPKNTDGVKVVAKYSGSRGYTQLLTMQPERFTDYAGDLENAEGGPYHVLYSDCTTFASLITKGIKYTDSPYFAFYENPSIQTSVLKGLSSDTDRTKLYTVDALNKWIGQSGSFNAAGSRLKKIYYNDNTNEEYNDVAIEHLETGDLIYFGNSLPENTEQVFGIHHVGVFVKTLDELNASPELGSGRLIKTPNGNISEKGYVVHCSVPYENGDSYNTVIRIETFEDMLKYDASKGAAWFGVWCVRPMQTILSSSKWFNRVTGFFPYWDHLIGKAQNNSGNDILIDLYNGNVNVHNVEMHNANANIVRAYRIDEIGLQVANNTSINSLVTNGLYKNRYTSYRIQDLPNPNYYCFILKNEGFMGEELNWQGKQTVTIYSLSAQIVEVYVRMYIQRAEQPNGWTPFVKLSS